MDFYAALPPRLHVQSLNSYPGATDRIAKVEEILWSLLKMTIVVLTRFTTTSLAKTHTGI
jgi:hypothetical protein